MEHSIRIPDHPLELGRSLYQLQQNGDLCDVGLLCKDGVVNVHKLILMSCGIQYVQHPESSETCFVSVMDYTVNIVSTLVQVLYTGHMQILSESVSDFINLCQFLGLKQFESSIRTFETAIRNSHISSVSNNVVSVCKEPEADDMFDPDKLPTVAMGMDTNTIQNSGVSESCKTGVNTTDLEILNSDHGHICSNSSIQTETMKRKQTSLILLSEKRRKVMTDGDIHHINTLPVTVDTNLSPNSDTGAICHVDTPADTFDIHGLQNSNTRTGDICHVDKNVDTFDSHVSPNTNTGDICHGDKSSDALDSHVSPSSNTGDICHGDKTSDTIDSHVSDTSNASQISKVCKQQREEQDMNDLDICVESKESSGDDKMTGVKQKVKADTESKFEYIKILKDKERSYSIDDYNAAFDAVVNKKMSIKAAGKKFNVPPGTLNYRLQRKKKNSPNAKRGSKAVFNEDQSEKLIRCFKILIKLGYKYTSEQFCEIATHYAVCLGKRKRDQHLAKHWFYLFINHFPDFKEMRKMDIDENVLQSEFFAYFSASLSKYSLQEKPELVYSMAAIELSCKPPYIVKRETLCENPGNEDTVTLLVCGNGTGNTFPPYFVLPESTTGLEIIQKDDTKCIYYVAENNLYNTEIFLKYLQTYFLKSEPETCKILLVDGHNLFLSVEAFDWAERNEVKLIVLPAEACKTLQPVEDICHTDFEEIFNAECKERTESPSTRVKIEDLLISARLAFSQAYTKDRIKQSFSSTGIYPLNKDITK